METLHRGAPTGTLTGRPHMRALLLNGALGLDPLLDDLTTRLTADFVARKYAVETVVLREISVAYCQGCFQCWTHTPGSCKIDDKGRDLAHDFSVSDVVVLVTPVLFGAYSSETKKMLDRTLGTLLPYFRRIDGEVHHMPRYAYPPALGVLAVENAPDTDNEKTVRVLALRNAINCAAPTHAVAVINRRSNAGAIFGECDTLVSTLTTPRTHAAEAHIDNVEDLLPRMPLSSDGAPPERAMLLVGSAKPRGASTSELLGTHFMERLALRGVEGEMRFVARETHSDETLAAFVADLRTQQLLIIASPVYIDSLPALVTRTLEAIVADRATLVNPPPLTVAMVLNCGFPEARHTSVARTIGALFARTARARWAGALQLGGGALIHGEELDSVARLAAHLVPLLDDAAASLAEGRSIPPETREEFRAQLISSDRFLDAGDAAWLWTVRHESALTRHWTRPAEVVG